MAKKLLKISTLCIILALIVGGILWYFNHEKLYPSTDDAYLQGHIVNISSQINGKVNKILVKNHQTVTQGQILFTLDPKSNEIALNQAQAKLKDTITQVKALKSAINAEKANIIAKRAQWINTNKNTQRILSLVKRQLASIADGDTARSHSIIAKAELNAAIEQYKEAQQKLGTDGRNNAKIEEARADAAQAELNLSHTTITAPTTGRIGQLTLRLGDTVTAYQSLFAEISGQHWWVAANFKETQLDRIRVGQPVTINLDMYPNHAFNGKVISFSPGSGASFSLLPPENATGNWVKVTQRFPVWISIDKNPKYPFRIGASATVTVDTTHRSHHG